MLGGGSYWLLFLQSLVRWDGFRVHTFGCLFLACRSLGLRLRQRNLVVHVYNVYIFEIRVGRPKVLFELWITHIFIIYVLVVFLLSFLVFGGTKIDSFDLALFGLSIPLRIHLHAVVQF